MSKANGSGGDELQATFLLDDEDAPAKPNGGGRTAKPAERGKRIKADAKPEAQPDEPAAEGGSVSPAAPAPTLQEEPSDEAQAVPETPAATEAEPEPEVQGPRVMRYGNDQDGCWVEFEDGTREPLSEDAWTNAMARHFKRDTSASN